MTITTEKKVQHAFFDFIFGENVGYVCIATQTPGKRDTFKQTFFEWPVDKVKLNDFVDRQQNNKNVWFGVNLLNKPERTKQYCKVHNVVWADLDTCDPAQVEPPPQCIIESSPDRWQAIWRLDELVDPYLAETYSKKIAYKYKVNGADPSGWDLTQLLRVPLTRNFKYGNAPSIQLHRINEVLCPAELFEALEVDIPNGDDPLDTDMPSLDALPDPIAVVYKYRVALQKTAFFELYDSDPPADADWSKLLWRFANICIEVGMDNEEAFAVCMEAKCNKYKRDGRPIRYLWREIVKADLTQRRLDVVTNNTYIPLVMPQIITENELNELPTTFIDTYRTWATNATDAVPQYHDLSAFVLLSSLLSSNLRLQTSYGVMVPNLWGLILGDSTLTRKSTAMRMAMDFVAAIDRDLVVATDGSAEGLLTGLSGRPNRVSIYFKDEVAGFFDSFKRKDYLAGMPETMAHLYDVPEFYSRRLRKETISVTNPVFIFYGGGIRDKMYQLISESDILSGFLPRFLIVSGDADLSKIRRTGPPTAAGIDMKNNIASYLGDLYENYSIMNTMLVGGQQVQTPGEVIVNLSSDAWERYGEIEATMVEAAYASPLSMLAMPTFERLSRSLLKMSVLLAASRMEPSEDNELTVEKKDVLTAARYVQDWGRYTVDLVMSSGRSVMQRTLEKIMRTIRNDPGILRSKVMQHHGLTKREMDEVMGTLLDRGEVTIQQSGRGYQIWAV